MNYTPRTRDQHLAVDGRPKRILALDGGGLRGILTLGILQHIEDLLRERHQAGPAFRLAHYFDLIAGTSTGAIIAAALAQGWTVAAVRDKYNQLGQQVFRKSLFRHGLLRAKYDANALSEELQRVYGEHTTLGSDQLQTGLMVMTKRLDSGSPWPLSNNPRGRYYLGNDQGRIANADYPLWKVVRASTAAPMYFDPEGLTIIDRTGMDRVEGNFVDGGVTPHNNPALQALMYATLEGYRVGWPLAADKLLLVSVGTGRADPAVARVGPAAGHAISALASLMEDCAAQQQILLQWLSSSPTARPIDRELGDLRHDLIARTPLVSYLRYDVDLLPAEVRALDPALDNDQQISALSEMDAPENMDTLHRLGHLAGLRDVKGQDFPACFDLPPN